MTSRLLRDAAWAIILCVVSIATAVAQQSAIEVRSPSTRLLETAPGRIITASVVVANRSGEAHDVVERFTLPPGCQRVAPPEIPFRLEPGGQSVRVLAVLVPANMAAGHFTLGYTAQSRRDPSSIGSVEFGFQVTPVDDLQLVVEPRPDLVLAGDTYTVKLAVMNRGNSRIAVRLARRSSLGFDVNVDTSAFTLESGASREILCTVKTDAAYAKHTRHAVTFDVAATSVSGKTLTASQASVAEIIPRVSGSRDVNHHLPMQLRLMTLAESDRDPQFQAELSGAGSLDEAGKHRVDFLFRGPDIQNSSLFGERDEYGASYRGEHWDIDLGDRIYSLSPLTQKHSLGRGGGVVWHSGKTAAGGFYMRTRYRQNDTEELGAFIRHDFTPSFRLQGNWLRKSGGDLIFAHALPQNIFTIESQYRRGKHLDFRVEAGMSRSDNGDSDFAYRVDARGELPGNLKYAIEHVHAGPDFHGYYSDTETTNLSLSKSFTPALRVHATMNRYAGNLALNDVRSSVVNREDSWNAGAEYSPNKKTVLSVEWQHVERADILQPVSYDFTSDSARVGVGHDFGQLKMQSFLDLGTLDNALTGEGGPFQRYSVTAHWQPTARQTYSFFANYGPNAFSGSSEKALGMGASANWSLRDDLDASVSYARNQFDGLTGNQQDQALASIRYRMQDRGVLSLIGRWSRSVTKTAGSEAVNEAAVMLTYSMPLSMPVSRKRSIGTLRGQITDAAKGGGLPRVVLQVGEHFAVTDETGAFEFPSLKPGACELRVVVDSLGPRMAMVTPMPMKVKVRPAETAYVELTASPACALTVRVARHEFVNGNALSPSSITREAGGQEGVAVELGNGRDVWRAQTDRTGAATFDRLPGGVWTLRLAGNDLPALHVLETPTQAVTLQPGRVREVVVRLLPLRRTLRLLDRGTVR